MTYRIDRLFKEYPYVIDVTGKYEHQNEMYYWVENNIGPVDSSTRVRFFFNYYKHPEFDKHKDAEAGCDFLLFSNKEDYFEFIIKWM